MSFASCVEVPTLDSGGEGEGGGKETVDLAELALTSHALMQVAHPPPPGVVASFRVAGMIGVMYRGVVVFVVWVLCVVACTAS